LPERTAATVHTLWSRQPGSHTFLVGLLAGAGLILQIHQWSTSCLNLSLCPPPPDFVKPTHATRSGPCVRVVSGHRAALDNSTVLAAAIASASFGFLLWSKRATSASFFLARSQASGFVLSFDIVWVHWIFDLHHLTNTKMDLVLEPLLFSLARLPVVCGSRESAAQANRAAY